MKAATRILAVLATAATIFPAGCATVSPVGSSAREASGIRGRVTLKSTGQPVAGAHVYAYKDYSKNLIGVADYVSKGSAEDGTFTLDLPPGEYYLVSRKRSSGANYGPIVKGDLYDHRFEQEAVRVPAGRAVVRDFQLTELREPLFFQVFSEESRRTEVGIRGRILDEKGQPMQGAFATAYRNSDMRRLPDYASTLSGDDGAYILYLPEGGRWYLGARSHARGVPVKGELVGRYEGSADHSVRVPEKGFLEGADITLRPFTSEPPAGYTPY